MIKAVLLDLDNTLIDINLTAFMLRYMAGQARILSRALRIAPPLASSAITAAYVAICSARRSDALLNEDLFDRVVRRKLRLSFDLEPLAEAISYYDSHYIKRFRGGLVQACPRPGSHRLIETARELGLTLALATNPVVSLAVDRVRMAWGELDPNEFADISHIGNSRRAKPCAPYFEEFAARLGYAPSECLMVGNDAGYDFPRPDIGMPVAYVGHGRPRKGVFRGSLTRLALCLPELVSSLDATSTRALPRRPGR